MDHPGSAYLCSIKRTLQQLLNPFSSGSTLTSLRPMTCRSMTRVAVVCHCWQDPTTPFLIREKFSCELNYQTYGTTRLGVYILKNDILYLNAGVNSLQPLPFNFIRTSLSYQDHMDHPGSAYLCSIKRTLQQLLNPFSSGSTLTSLRPMTCRSMTRVAVVCHCWQDPTTPFLIREKFSCELNYQTYGTTRLGVYILKNDILYLNAGVNSLQPLPFNFIRTSLSYQDHMDHPGSAYLCSIKRTLQQLLNPFSSGSTLTSLREKFSCELNYQTYGTTRLGVYILKNDILYLNGELPN
ncbi:mucin-16-like isoform X2 [Notamacropus eugenii]|uniref:mucin-16-like isoform X2 n=1 Tax=Notamacropus eugenii TaxID=9315 RepID=UPI003B66F6C4